MHVGTSFMSAALPWYSKASTAQSTSGRFAFKVDGGHAGTHSYCNNLKSSEKGITYDMLTLQWDALQSVQQVISEIC